MAPNATKSWQAYEPWRTGIIPVQQETKYSQFLLGTILFGMWVPVLAVIGRRELAEHHNARPLYLLAVITPITLLFLYKYFRARGPVKAVLTLATVPVSPGDRLKAEIIFDQHTRFDSPIDLYLRAYTVGITGVLVVKGRLQPVRPTLRVIRKGGDKHRSLVERHRQVRQISADQVRPAQRGFACQVEFDIPGDAPEASTEPGRTITVWTLMCQSKSFDFDLWFGHLPVFRS